MAQKGKYAKGGSWSIASGMNSPKPEKPPKKAAPKAPPKKKPPKKRPAEEAPKPTEAEEKPQTPLQRAWSIISSILSYTLMVAAIGMAIFTAVSTASFDRNDRDILGYKFFIVRSDSMSATDFSAGDLVIAKEWDVTLLNQGDIIAFRSEDPNSYGETFTHKIRSIERDEWGTPTFTTYGTTTGIDDVFPVPAKNVIGKYVRAIPKLGTFFMFLKTTPGYICCIFLPFLLMLLIQFGNSVRLGRKLIKEEQAEHDAENEKKEQQLKAQFLLLAKAREENKQIMQELQELREQLQKQDQ